MIFTKVGNARVIRPTGDPVYWLAAGNQTVHFGILEPHQEVCTGQPDVREYTTRRGWRLALKRLGVPAAEIKEVTRG